MQTITKLACILLLLLLSSGLYAQLIVDPTFNSADRGFSLGDRVDYSSTAIEVLSDGKSLIGGGFGQYDGINRNCIARLNADGTLDSSFNPGTGFDAQVEEIKLQTDGKILIGGHFTTCNGTARNRIARLNVVFTKRT